MLSCDPTHTPNLIRIDNTKHSREDNSHVQALQSPREKGQPEETKMTELSPLWNQKLLKSPPICNLKIEVTVTNIDKLKSMKQIFEKCLTILNDDTALSTEICVLSRLIYKRNLQLRREKTMQFLKQIEKCMKRYNDMDIKKHILDFKRSFDDVEIKRGICIYLPSQQMFQFLLVKIISLTMLLSQTIFYCYKAFIWCKMGLDHGHLVPQYLLYISVTSRIWVLCKSQYLHCINWYRRLFPLKNILEATQVEWLPTKDTLPKDLEVFVKKNCQSHLQCPSGESQFKVESMIQQYFNNTNIKKDNAMKLDHDNDNTMKIEDDNGNTMKIEDDNGNTIKIEDDNGNTMEMEHDNDNTMDIDSSTEDKSTSNQNDVEKELEEEEEEDIDYNGFEEDLGAPVARNPIKATIQTKTSMKPTKECQSFKDLIDVINSCSDFLTQDKAKCLESLKLFQNQYRVAKKNGKGTELKERLFPKALKKVNLFLKKYKSECSKNGKHRQLPKLVWKSKSKQVKLASKASDGEDRRGDKDKKIKETSGGAIQDLGNTTTNRNSESAEYLQMVEGCQNITDLIEVVQSCDQLTHSNFSEHCIQSLRNMNQNFSIQKPKAKQKALTKAKKDVVYFIQNFQNNQKTVNGHGHDSIMDFENGIQEIKSDSVNSVKFEVKSVEDLVQVMETVRHQKEIVLSDNVRLPLNKTKQKIVLKKLKWCQQKLENSELKNKQKQRLLLKSSNSVMNVLNK